MEGGGRNGARAPLQPVNVHKLLQRQIQQFFGDKPVPAHLAPFLAAVEAAYGAAEQERILLERSLGVTSQALLTRNMQLQRDLAEKRQAEEGRERCLAALRETLEATTQSESRYRLLFEASPQPMWVCDAETLAFLAVNDAAASLYGFSREEFLAMRVTEVQAPEDPDGRSAGAEAVAGDLPARRLMQHRTRDGARISIELLAHSIQLDGRPVRLAVIAAVT
jgi:PAS domain S-box-containing protein